jgi:hypothetical protein
MNEIRLAWEPSGLAPLEVVARQVAKYMENKASFAQFENGTCLMLKPVPNLEEVIRGALEEARHLPDFKVYAMEGGDFLVFFATPLMVYVGKEEFAERESELQRRVDELRFPSEAFVTPNGMPPKEMLVGLYARAKLQRDAREPQRYTVVTPRIDG